mgnify:CR=1 FL=1
MGCISSVCRPSPYKEENIGLIEVMGLAVLPARLKKEMALLEQYILEKQDVRSNPQIEKHADWVDSWLGSYEITEDNIHAILQKEIGKSVCPGFWNAPVYIRIQKREELISDGLSKLCKSRYELTGQQVV